MTSWDVVSWLTVLLRLALVFSPGYIHPDEFFQSPEIAAGSVWPHAKEEGGLWRAWEFDPLNPCRSILPPWLVSGFSFRLIETINSHILGRSHFDLSGWALLVGPRLWLFVLSLSGDLVLRRLLRWPSLPSSFQQQTILLYNLSIPVLIFTSRPFSNSVETLWFVLALSLIPDLHSPSSKRHQQTTLILLGILMSLGIFTRFTFCFFIAPVLLLVIHTSWINSSNISKFIQDVISKVLTSLIGFIITTFFIIQLDSWYFQPSDSTIHVTAWNSFIYNLNPENLAEHGLHPRWLHSVLNMSLLFGPLWFFIIPFSLILFFLNRKETLIASIFSSSVQPPKPKSDLASSISGDGVLSSLHHRQNRSQNKDNERSSQLKGRSTKVESQGKLSLHRSQILFVTMAACCVSGLGLLSAAPHQEPRFLIPLTMPLIICGSLGLTLIQKKLRKTSHLALLSLLLFNFLFVIFYGFLHQGGIVPSLINLPSLVVNPNQHSSAIFYGVYMPPRYLVNPINPLMEIVDVGTNTTKLVDSIQRALARSPLDPIFVVFPQPLVQEISTIFSPLSFSLEVVAQTWPHLSTENFPSSLAEMSLTTSWLIKHVQ